MSDDTKKTRSDGPASARAGREERLAEALRANLRRRKSQARARSRGEEGGADTENGDAGADS